LIVSTKTKEKKFKRMMRRRGVGLTAFAFEKV